MEWYCLRRKAGRSRGLARRLAGGAPVGRLNRTIMTRALLVGVVLAAMGVTGCGRKGALEPPPGAAVATPDKSGDTAQKPSKPFFLDPLLGK